MEPRVWKEAEAAEVGGAASTPASWGVPLLAGALVAVPVTMWPTSTEAFVLPKLVALGLTLGLASLALWRLRHTTPGIRLTLLDRLIAGFAGLVLVSQVLSIAPTQSLLGDVFQRQGTLASLGYVGTYVATRCLVRSQRPAIEVARAAAVGGSLVGGYALIQALGLDPLWPTTPGLRVFSSVGQPNSLGAYLVVTIPITVWMASRARRRGWFWLAAAGLQFAALILTQSRGAYLAMGVATVVAAVVVVRLPDVDLRRMARPLAVGIAICVLALAPLGSSVGHALDRIGAATATGSGSVAQHLDLWRSAVAMVDEHPVIGTGPSTFSLRFPGIRDQVLPPDRAQAFLPYRVESPHNVYLAIAVGSGVIAASLYALMWLVAVVHGLRTAGFRPAEPNGLGVALGISLIGFAISQSFITADVTASFVAWALLGLVPVTSQWAAREPAEPS